MIRYVIKRIILMIPVMLAVTVLMFLLSSLSAGDSARIIAEKTYNAPTQEQIEEIRHREGLDKPLFQQYFSWLGKVVQGDFGESYNTGRPALQELQSAFPVTLRLALKSLVLLLAISVPLGVFSAVYENSLFDKITEVFSFLSVSMPAFWLGLMLLYLFGVKLRMISVIGGTSGEVPLVAAFSMDIGFFGVVIRMIRVSLRDSLKQDYIRACKAKGIPVWKIIWKHGMKNSLIPVSTKIVSIVISLLCGSAVIESIFSLNGIGALALEAVTAKDTPVLQCFILILSAVVVLLNLLADISYSAIDRRIQLK